MKLGPFAKLALDMNESAVTAHDSVNNRQPKTGTLARTLGREERFEYSPHRFRAHPQTGIRHNELNVILSGLHLPSQTMTAVGRNRLGGNRDLAAVLRHSV